MPLQQTGCHNNMLSPPSLAAGIATPERDPLAKLWALDPDVRALVCVALSFGILIFGVNGWLPCLVYVLAVAPGAVFMRSALWRYPGAVSNAALARSALAGVIGSLLILLYEQLVQMVVFFIFIAHGLQSGIGVASVVFLAIGEAFLMAALCEEWVKVRLTRRALHFEGVTSPTAVMLHAAAASAAFACLENVFYLNFRAVDETGGTPRLVTIMIRCFLCVPIHIMWGVTSGAGLAMHHFGGSERGVLTWTALFHLMWPSTFIHGFWDVFIFLNDYLGDMTVQVLVAMLVLPPITGFVCRRRIMRLRQMEETMDLSGDAESGFLHASDGGERLGGSVPPQVAEETQFAAPAGSFSPRATVAHEDLSTLQPPRPPPLEPANPFL